MVARVHAAGRKVQVALALALIALLLGGGISARHHAAAVAHVTDARTGITSHAPSFECHGRGVVSHIHGTGAQGDTDDCDVMAALHAPVRAALATIVVAAPPALAPLVAVPPAAPPRSSPLLLSAPKTSPPSIA